MKVSECIWLATTIFASIVKRRGSVRQPPERAAADVTAEEIGKVTAYIRPELDAAEMGWTRLNVWLSGPAS